MFPTKGSIFPLRKLASSGGIGLRSTNPSYIYVNLELYMAWRGRGLSIETPGVRRCREECGKVLSTHNLLRWSHDPSSLDISISGLAFYSCE